MIKELQSLGLDIKILTEDNQEVSIAELSSDELDNTPSLGAEVEQELKDVSINFEDILPENGNDTDDTGVSQDDIAANEFDQNSLFDDFDDLDE